MHLSINPLYRCNLRCPNCYLTPRQLSSRQLLDLGHLEARLSELPSISSVELYGGEVALLPRDYYEALYGLVRRFYSESISVITNLTIVPQWLLQSDIEVSVSFDFEHRQQYETVLTNLLTLPKAVTLIILATPEVVGGDFHQQLALVKSLSNVSLVEIKPYSSNQANQVLGTNELFVRYVKRWLESDFPKERLKNLTLMEQSITGTRNAYSDNHLYITPEGRFAVLEFDAEDREYFLSLEHYQEYLAWCEREREVVQSLQCRSCRYLGSCLTEHYRRNEGELDECSGFKTLLDWWVERKAETLSPLREET